MNIRLPGLAALSLVLAAGCASNDQAVRTVDPKQLDADQAYMAQVEASGRKAGVRVVWINPPTRKHEQVARND